MPRFPDQPKPTDPHRFICVITQVQASGNKCNEGNQTKWPSQTKSNHVKQSATKWTKMQPSAFTCNQVQPSESKWQNWQ